MNPGKWSFLSLIITKRINTCWASFVSVTIMRLLKKKQSKVERKLDEKKLPDNTSDMVATCRVYKKTCPNGKVTLYLPKREYIDHITCVDPIEGVVLLDDEYLKGRHVFAHVVATFRYGREDDEVMGLKFVKELYLCSEQIYPPPSAAAAESDKQVSKTQMRLMEKLGCNAYAFNLKLPDAAPHSVMLQPGNDEEGQPCGVYYEVRLTVGTSKHDKGHKRNSVSMSVRKVQRANLTGGHQPCSVIRKDFLLSPGHLELEATLDRQVFKHGDPISVNIAVRNYSSKTVKRIKVYVIQNADVCMFASGHCRTIIASLESGCPVGPGGTLHKVVEMRPPGVGGGKTRGVALDAPVGDEEPFMASSTILPEEEEKNPFGIVVSYSVKVKLVLGALGGEVVSELPFVLMNTGERTTMADDIMWVSLYAAITGQQIVRDGWNIHVIEELRTVSIVEIPSGATNRIRILSTVNGAIPKFRNIKLP